MILEFFSTNDVLTRLWQSFNFMSFSEKVSENKCLEEAIFVKINIINAEDRLIFLNDIENKF